MAATSLRSKGKQPELRQPPPAFLVGDADVGLHLKHTQPESDEDLQSIRIAYHDDAVQPPLTHSRPVMAPSGDPQSLSDIQLSEHLTGLSDSDLQNVGAATGHDYGTASSSRYRVPQLPGGLQGATSSQRRTTPPSHLSKEDRRIDALQGLVTVSRYRISSRNGPPMTDERLLEVARHVAKIDFVILPIVRSVMIQIASGVINKGDKASLSLATAYLKDFEDIVRQFQDVETGDSSFHEDYLCDNGLFRWWSRLALFIPQMLRGGTPDTIEDFKQKVVKMEAIGGAWLGSLQKAQDAGVLDAGARSGTRQRWLKLNLIIEALSSTISYDRTLPDW
ncbi:hypothetical protein LTR85_010719 [Meristemomyces frigidus]|nr:hypothetical protein LTR85_010719 [Meristemomyces frigidus]